MTNFSPAVKKGVERKTWIKDSELKVWGAIFRARSTDGTFMLRRCGKKTAKAHAQRRRNKKLAASAMAKEQGKEKKTSPEYELWMSLGCRLWGQSQV